MTVVLAALAGVLAAAGLVDALEARERRRPPTRRRNWATALSRLGRRVGGPRPADDLETRLQAAGSALAVADATAIKAGTAITSLAATLPLAAGAPGKTGVLIAVAATGGGFIVLDLHLRRKARQRAHRMSLELPDVLDLLRVAVQAGLPPTRALAEVGARHGGLLAAELRVAAERAELGVPRREALEQLTARAPIPGTRALVAAMHRAERHGAPLAPALQALATDARAEHARCLKEEAARAAPKIQLVIALLLVPAVMLLVAAALVGGLL